MNKFFDWILKWKLRLLLISSLLVPSGGWLIKKNNDVHKMAKSVEVGIAFMRSNSALVANCEKADGTFVQIRTAKVNDRFTFIDNARGPDEMYGSEWSNARNQFNYKDYRGKAVWLKTEWIDPEYLKKLKDGI